MTPIPSTSIFQLASSSQAYYGMFPNLSPDLIDDVYFGLKHDPNQMISTLLHFHTMFTTCTLGSKNVNSENKSKGLRLDRALSMLHTNPSSSYKASSPSSIIGATLFSNPTSTSTSTSTSPSLWKSLSQKWKKRSIDIPPQSRPLMLSVGSMVKDSGVLFPSCSTSTMSGGEDTRIILACSPWHQITVALDGGPSYDEPMYTVALQ